MDQFLMEQQFHLRNESEFEKPFRTFLLIINLLNQCENDNKTDYISVTWIWCWILGSEQNSHIELL